jgi:glycosyltransferase involved in cell wall biosynthesis
MNQKVELNNNVDVCVIVRTCARPLFLRRALYSIQAQTIRPRQVVVVAEGCDGASARAAVAGNWSGPAATVEVIANPVAVGRGAALNQGLRAAHTTWIAVLDDDDTWEPTFLEKTIDCLEHTTAETQGVVTLTTVVLENEKENKIRELQRYPFNPSNLNAVTLQGIAGGSQFTINAFVYAREAALAIGGYNNDLPVQEDWEFNIRFLKQYSVGLLPSPLAFYHRRPQVKNIAVANTSTEQHEAVRQQIIDRWLREELKTGRFGLGHLCMQAGFQREFAAAFRFKRRLLRLLQRLGLRRG